MVSTFSTGSLEARQGPTLIAWLAKPRPSCRQATMASVSPQWSLHTAPQRRTPFTSTCTSTTPSSGLRPPAKRTCSGQRCVRSTVASGAGWGGREGGWARDCQPGDASRRLTGQPWAELSPSLAPSPSLLLEDIWLDSPCCPCPRQQPDSGRLPLGSCSGLALLLPEILPLTMTCQLQRAFVSIIAFTVTL